MSRVRVDAKAMLDLHKLTFKHSLLTALVKMSDKDSRDLRSLIQQCERIKREMRKKHGCRQPSLCRHEDAWSEVAPRAIRICEIIFRNQTS